MIKLYATVAFMLLTTVFFTAKAQTTPGPAERKLADSLCNELSRVDMSKITSKEDATNTFTQCFAKYSNLLVEVAEERDVDMTDQTAMRNIGIEIGKDLMRNNCAAFLTISAKMAGKGNDQQGSEATGTTQGTFKRIENKGFNYLIINDAANKERSFLWLRQFVGSEKFTGLPASYAGKKLRVKWQEIEVYLPQAKGYYKVKEITAIDIL